MAKKEIKKTKKSVVDQAKRGLHDVENKATEAFNETSKAVQKVVNKKNMEKGQEYVEGFAHGLKENAHMILAVVSLAVGIFILWDIIIGALEIAVGASFIILAYLLATDFFKKGKNKAK